MFSICNLSGFEGEIKAKYISLTFICLKYPYPASLTFLSAYHGFCGLPPKLQYLIYMKSDFEGNSCLWLYIIMSYNYTGLSIAEALF